MRWNEVSVFISSTFKDMHAERDYILKNVFPQLGEWCERRHIVLHDIDLRWGVTPQDSQTQNTIYKCLAAVDSCRPFFLCFLGQRRGWVPTLDRINQRTRETFPEIVRMAQAKSHSATEYEIEHALLMPLAYFEDGAMRRKEPVRNALFLRRRPNYLADLSPAQKKIFLDDPKENNVPPEGYDAYMRECAEANQRTYERISEKNLILDYDCRWDRNVVSPELVYGEQPKDDSAQGRLTDFTIREADLPRDLRARLLDILRSEFPAELPEGKVWPLKAYLLAAYVQQLLPYAEADIRETDRYERDAEQQRVFMNACLRDAVPRSQEMEDLRAYCDGDSRSPLLILAESGMGKTTLSAQFASQRQGVLARFLGVSELSGGLYPLWDSILQEAGLPVPSDLDTLRARLPALLAAMSPRVLLLDGLEQIPGGPDLLEQIPAPLPEGIKVILTIDARAEQLTRFLRFHAEYPLLTLSPFSNEQKEELVQTSLRSSLKELSPELMEYVCGLDESGNPLYLSILLNDIRSFSSNSRLQKEIGRHGSTPLAAFDAMLARMESDRMFDMLPPDRCVPLVFGLLAAARDGLTYDELTDCLAEYFPEASRDMWAGSLQICLRQVRAFLRRCDGRTDFRHQVFRMAAQRRYASREGEFHAALARLFRRECDPDKDDSFPIRDQRALREYAWQLAFLSEADLARLYTNVCYLNARCEGQYVRDLIREYDSPLLGGCAPYRSLLIRYRDGLEENANLLPSLLWAYGPETAREEAAFARLRCPWIRSEGLSPKPEQPGADEDFAHLRVLGETTYHAAAFCFAGETPYAFAFTGQGQVTAYDVRNILPLSNPLYTAKAMPLGLCASDHVLAAAFENEHIELYAFETDETALRSKPLADLRYLPPLYSGAAMCFDRNGCLWYQPKEETVALYDPASGREQSFSLARAEELSSLAASGDGVFGTACVGRGTMLFCLDASGALHTRDLGIGDSRVLCADANGCLVSCAAQGGDYPLLRVDPRLETLAEIRLCSPVTAAARLDPAYLLLPAKQTLGQLWLWDGERCKPVEQRLLYQDQARLSRLADGSVAMLSAGTITRMAFGSGQAEPAAARAEGSSIPADELPDLREYGLQVWELYKNGDYACAAGVSYTMRSVRDEQCAGAVFLKKTFGRWRVLGAQTWPRALELIRTVCIDPDSGRYTLLLRSEVNVHTVCAVQGTVDAICSGKATPRDLALPQNKTNHGCFAGGWLYLSAGNLLQAYEARDLSYETALLMPAPITSVEPDGERAAVRAGGQGCTVAVQKGERA